LPESLLCDKFSKYRLARLLNSFGILPVRLLACTVSTSNFSRFESSGGKLPVIMFSSIAKKVKLMFEAQVLDKYPEKLFLSNFALISRGYGPKDDISPVILLELRKRNFRLLHVSRLLGIGPVNMLFLTAIL
jgi:hypothetical protein